MSAIPNLVRAIGNQLSTTLASSISDSDLTLNLTSVTGFNTSGGYIIIDENTTSEEIIYIESITGTVATIATSGRGLCGTVASSHSNGAIITDIIVDKHIEGYRTAFIAEHNDDGTHQDLYGGWILSGETWTYASADAPSFTFTITGDKTTKYYAGMRVKLTQTTDKYFIITKVSYSAPNTTVTIYGGTDYTLVDATISSPKYSREKAPAGFPLDPTKWTVTVTDTTVRSQTNAVYNTWYNIGTTNCQISVPIGLWDLGYNVNFWIDGNDTITGFAHLSCVTLSTANNSESDKNLSASIYSRLGGNTASMSTSDYNVGILLSRNKITNVSSKTTYYLNAQNGYPGITPNLNFNATQIPTIIYVRCAYL